MSPETLGFPWLHTYGVLVAIAFLTALWLAGRLDREAGLSADAITNLGIYCALAAIAGAKLMMFLVDIPYYTQHAGEMFSLATLQAGGVFYGGPLAGPGGAGGGDRECQKPRGGTPPVFSPPPRPGLMTCGVCCF